MFVDKSDEASIEAAVDAGVSAYIVDGLKQAPSRAMLRAVGYKDADFKKPAIGVASTWRNLTPCNMHIDRLARAAAAAVDKAGGKSTTFGRLKCTSRTTGITCKSLRSGHGFTVSTTKQRVF